MKITLSVIKADIGSIGGHIRPSEQRFGAVREHVSRHGAAMLPREELEYTGIMEKLDALDGQFRVRS